MGTLLRGGVVAGILALMAVGSVLVLGGDVVIQEGVFQVVDGLQFKSQGCDASGSRAAAFGQSTVASGACSLATGYGSTGGGAASVAMGFMTRASGIGSVAMGWLCEANGYCGTAIGRATKANGHHSTAMGYYTTASANYSSASGHYCDNEVQESFAVGFGSGSQNTRVDLRVENGIVTVGDRDDGSGDLCVVGDVEAEDYLEGSSFYDGNAYGRALDHLTDSSNLIKLNAQGSRVYNYEAEPAFLKKRVTVKDYDKFTEEGVWDKELHGAVTKRIYETHEEERGSLGMKVAWLRQCVFELKKENEMLKAELTKVRTAVGVRLY